MLSKYIDWSIIHEEFLSQGQTAHGWVLYQNNAFVDDVLSLELFLIKTTVIQVPFLQKP